MNVIERRFRTIQRQLRRTRSEEKITYKKLSQRSGLSVRACHECLNKKTGHIPSWLVVETLSRTLRQSRPVLKDWT